MALDQLNDQKVACELQLFFDLSAQLLSVRISRLSDAAPDHVSNIKASSNYCRIAIHYALCVVGLGGRTRKGSGEPGGAAQAADRRKGDA
ncbi:hypothetical protein, partial [Paractinoplanes rishiriensis]|uniref:hypothetical protein n=1 Tax=Paractinoplanes rishiriensis TaxID=1050105 RepID=UPI00194105A6